jgi:hypothetical protein
MTMSDNDLKPEEFAQAAAEAITDAQTRGFRDAAQVLANAGLCGVCALEDAGGLQLGIDFAVPIVAEAGRLRLHWPLLETILITKALGDSPLAAELVGGARVATWALQGSLQGKLAQLRYGFRGQIPDGMLVRASTIDPDDERAFEQQARFLQDLLAAVPPETRKRLSGLQ